MKLDSIIPLATADDTRKFMHGLWKTDMFRKSQEDGGFIFDVVERFASLPCFFFHASDEVLEKAHFSTWWRGMEFRDYDNPYIHDLYYLHEIYHAGTMLYSENLSPSAFARKMQDNELEASTASEIEVYFRMPGLREHTFPHEIFADRFLSDETLKHRWEIDPDRVVKELRLYRQNIMMSSLDRDHHDRTEFWIKQFSYQNETWASTWIHNYQAVESAVVRMRTKVDAGDREGALRDHLAWLTSPEVMPTGDIPFLDEAKAFAGSYLLNKAMYEKEFGHGKTSAPVPAPEPARLEM